ALIILEELGIQKIVVEGDSLTVKKEVVSAKEDESVNAALIKESKERIKNFESLNFRFVPCSTNRAAHEMAQERKLFDSPMFWIEETLEKMERIAYLDRWRMVREECSRIFE
ncbi:hypothetical protein J1N35_022167, partial [Gossypium stocksii]